MKSTHEEFINIPGMGHAFITGVPDKCDHDYSLEVYELGNGEYLFKKDHLCPTDESTYEHIQYLAEQKGTQIVGGTTACSKCRKLFTWADIQAMEWESLTKL